MATTIIFSQWWSGEKGNLYLRKTFFGVSDTLMMLKSPKKWKIIPAKVLVHKSHVSECIFHGSRKNQNQFPEDGKIYM